MVADFHIKDEGEWVSIHGCVYCSCEKACEIYGCCIELVARTKYEDKNASDLFVRKIKMQCKSTPIEGIERLNLILSKPKKEKKYRLNKLRLTSFEKVAISLIKK